MSNNKENNMKLHQIITKMWTDIKTKFGSYYTKTQSDNRIEYRKDKVEFFAVVQTGTKFEDATLFDKQLLPVGDAILGGTWGTSTKGSIPASTAIQAGHNHSLLGTSNTGTNSDAGALNPNAQFTFGKSLATQNNDGDTYQEKNRDGKNWVKDTTPAITIHQTVAHNTTGTVDAKGIELVVVAYRAKKNITFAEMGNLGGDENGGV